MTHTAKGTFSVDLEAEGEAHTAEGVSLGRMRLSKRFEGDLIGQGEGLMLTAMTPVKGSAGYVAIERFTGSLMGRSGSFVFQHAGSMNQGTQQLSITVVPDSGTGALKGLTGQFRIRIENGQHFYEFDHSLPAP